MAKKQKTGRGKKGCLDVKPGLITIAVGGEIICPFCKGNVEKGGPKGDVYFCGECDYQFVLEPVKISYRVVGGKELWAGSQDEA